MSKPTSSIQFDTETHFAEKLTEAAKDRGLSRKEFCEILVKQAFDQLIPIDELVLFRSPVTEHQEPIIDG